MTLTACEVRGEYFVIPLLIEPHADAAAREVRAPREEDPVKAVVLRVKIRNSVDLTPERPDRVQRVQIRNAAREIVRRTACHECQLIKPDAVRNNRLNRADFDVRRHDKNRSGILCRASQVIGEVLMVKADHKGAVSPGGTAGFRHSKLRRGGSPRASIR